MKAAGKLRRLVPSTGKVSEASEGAKRSASRLSHYYERGMTSAVPGAKRGVNAEADRAAREAKKLRGKSLATGAGYGTGIGAGSAVLVGAANRDGVKKNFVTVSKQGSLRPLTKPKTAKKPKMPKAPVNAAKPRVAGKPSINRSYVATSRAGKKFSARGSVR